MSRQLRMALLRLSFACLVGGMLAVDAAAHWGVIETANFRVHHRDPSLGEPVARRAESLRVELIRRWFDETDAEAWLVRCDVYLHATTESYLAAAGPGAESSAGISSIEFDNGRVVRRRIDLNGTDKARLDGVLPHELTHVTIAEGFGSTPPRWADEALAILAEPEEKRAMRQRDFLVGVRTGIDFSLRELFALEEYPSVARQRVFYGQSAAIAERLIEQGGGPRFVDFLRQARRRGVDDSLRKIYAIDGVDALERSWRASLID